MPKRVMHLNIIRYYYLSRNGLFQIIFAKTKGPLSPFGDLISYKPASLIISSLTLLQSCLYKLSIGPGT